MKTVNSRLTASLERSAFLKEQSLNTKPETLTFPFLFKDFNSFTTKLHLQVLETYTELQVTPLSGQIYNFLITEYNKNNNISFVLFSSHL